MAEHRAVCAQDEGFELLTVALPLAAYRSRAHLALDGTPKPPCPLSVPAFYGKKR